MRFNLREFLRRRDWRKGKCMKWLASADNAQRSVAPTIGRHRRMLPKLETIALATIKEDCTRQRDLVNEKTTIKSKDIVAATIKATDALIASQNEIRRKLEREPFDPSGVKEEDDDISLVSGISLGQISDHLLEEVLEGNEGKIMGMEEIHSDLYTEPSDSIPQSYDSYESIFDLNTDKNYHPVPSPRPQEENDACLDLTSIPPEVDNDNPWSLCADPVFPRSSTPRPVKLESRDSVFKTSEAAPAHSFSSTEIKSENPVTGIYVPDKIANFPAGLTSQQKSALEEAFQRCIYAGHIRQHVLARELDLRPGFIKNFFKKQRSLFFRKLQLNGGIKEVTAVRSFHQGTLQVEEAHYRERSKKNNSDDFCPTNQANKPSGAGCSNEVKSEPENLITQFFPQPRDVLASNAAATSNSRSTMPVDFQSLPQQKTCSSKTGHMIQSEPLAFPTQVFTQSPCWFEPGVMAKFALSSEWVNSHLNAMSWQQFPGQYSYPDYLGLSPQPPPTLGYFPTFPQAQNPPFPFESSVHPHVQYPYSGYTSFSQSHTQNNQSTSNSYPDSINNGMNIHSSLSHKTTPTSYISMTLSRGYNPLGVFNAQSATPGVPYGRSDRKNTNVSHHGQVPVHPCSYPTSVPSKSDGSLFQTQQNLHPVATSAGPPYTCAK